MCLGTHPERRMSDGRVEGAEPCRSSSSASSGSVVNKTQQRRSEQSEELEQQPLQPHQQKKKRQHPEQNLRNNQHHPHPKERKSRAKSQTSESLVSAGEASVKSSERRRPVHEEEVAENKRIAYIVAAATGLIFFAAFILIAVTLKMTPRIDEMRMTFLLLSLKKPCLCCLLSALT